MRNQEIKMEILTKLTNKGEKSMGDWGKRIIGHIKLTRPPAIIWLDFIPAVTFFVVITHNLPSFIFLLFILGIMFFDMTSSTVNDIADIKSDRRSIEPNRKHRPIVLGIISKRAASYRAITLFVVGCVIFVYLSFYNSPLIFLFALLLGLLGIQYSLPPLKMGARPIISTIFWPMLWIIYYLTLISYIGWDKLGQGWSFLMAVVVFMGLAEPLAKDIRDVDNDKRGGKITTVVSFGVPISALASLTLSIIGSLMWIYTFYTFPPNNEYFFTFIIMIFIVWNTLCLILTRRLVSQYKKKDGRSMHLGFILTFTCANFITIAFFLCC
jgi:4-hydroxybenzoate polyprenyltransferase